MALRPDVEEAVARHAAEAYQDHQPSRFAIDLLNGMMGHLERSCVIAGFDPTETRRLLDTFLSNVLPDIQDGADRDKYAREDELVRKLRQTPRQDLPPVKLPPAKSGWIRPSYWRETWERDMPDRSIEP